MRLKALLSLLLIVLSASPALAAGARLFTLHEVGPGVWAAISPNGSRAGANTGFVIGQNGVAVIDSFQNVEAARELLADIRQRTSLPIRFLINTHYHLDHMTGNGVFAAAGAVIVANRNVRAWAHIDNLKFFGPSPTAADRARVDAIVLPSLVFNHGVDLFLGKRELIVRHMPGHTGSDSIIVVPDAHVVFTGDLLWTRHLPNLIDASTGPWIRTLDTLATRYPHWTLVPGHGDVARPGDLQALRGYLVFLRAQVAHGLAAGKTGQALVDALAPAFRRRYGTWGFFQHFLAPNILETAAELQGRKHLPGGRVN